MQILYIRLSNFLFYSLVKKNIIGAPQKRPYLISLFTILVRIGILMQSGTILDRR